MANPDMRNMQDHNPHRGDQIEAWIKDRRDAWDDMYSAGAGYHALDNLLDEYREAADTGMTLEEVVNKDLYDEERQATPRTKKTKVGES